MKKVFLLNFIEEIGYIKKNLVNDCKLVAINLDVYLEAKKEKLEVINFDEIVEKGALNFQNHENDFNKLIKNIDQNVCILKGLEKIEVLVNSNKFNTLMKYILKQSIIIKSISNYFNDCSIYFFENNQRKNDLFKEIFNNLHLQKKILKKEISIKPLQTNNLLREKFFNEEKRKANKVKDLLLNLIQFFKDKFSYKKKNVLYYLLEKEIINNTKKSFNYINYEINSKFIFEKKINKKINNVIINFSEYFSDSFLNEFKSNFVDDAINYYYDVYIHHLNLSKKILNEGKFRIFITSHNSLVSSAILKNCSEMGIKSLVLHHGGAIPHLFNLEKFPNWNLNFMNNMKSTNYFQVYSDRFKECIIKNNKQEKFSKNIIVLPYVNKNLVKKKFSTENLKIGYFCQANFVHFLDYTKTGINNEITLYNIRQKIFDKFNSYNNIELNISSYGDKKENICSKKNFENFKKKNKINFFHYNSQKILNSCDFFIIEQLSTVFIQSLSLKKPTILFKNENYDFSKYFNEVNLEKNLFLSKSEDEILKNIEIIFKNFEKNKSYLEHSHILSKYYNLDNNYKSYEQKMLELID